MSETSVQGELAGKVAIVTGAGSGIARAVAIRFAQGGASVVVNDVDRAAAERTAAEITSSGGRAALCVVPVGDEQAAEALVRTAEHELGGIHILANIAGAYHPAPITDMTTEIWEKVVRVHLFAAFHNCKAAIKVMKGQGHGRIINTVSRAGLRGFPPGECNYSAAKAGIAGLTLALAYELLSSRITVNAVSPVAWTRLAENLPAEEKEKSRAARAKGVLGRPGMPEDVAEIYFFLATDRAAYLTGQIIQATGEPMHLV